MANDAQQDYILLKYLDGAGQLLQRINDLCQDTAAGPGWSQILDVNRCPTYALPWLAQLIGVRFSPYQNTDALQRAAIQSEQGFTRGTPAALAAAASRYLKPNQTVTIFERDTDPYHFTVVLGIGQLVGATYGYLGSLYPTYADLTGAFATYSIIAFAQDEINTALEAAKPAGLMMTVTAVASATYSTLSSDYATYSDLESAFSSYALMIAFI